MSSRTKFIPTGNQYLSLSDIKERDAAILGFSFLHTGYEGGIEVKGDDEHEPLLAPYLVCDDQTVQFQNLSWNLWDDWIPQFTMDDIEIILSGTILAPIDERGFIYHLSVQNISKTTHNMLIGFKGIWKKTLQVTNKCKEMKAEQNAHRSICDQGVVFNLGMESPTFSFVSICEPEGKCDYYFDHGGAIAYDFSRERTLEPNQILTFDFVMGIGLEEESASRFAKEIISKSFEFEFFHTLDWLRERRKSVSDPCLDQILNRNMFFHFFFATGITLDTGNFVLTTSRCSRYHVNTSYKDKNQLLWGFRSVLMMDHEIGFEMLRYMFKRLIICIDSQGRYVNDTFWGTGLELDEICAPIIALYHYVKISGDTQILQDMEVQAGIACVLDCIENIKDHGVGLYENYLQQTDTKPTNLFVTYNNVLAWRMLTDLSVLYSEYWLQERIIRLRIMADELKKAIYKHCVKIYQGKKIFVRCIDREENYKMNDEPLSSLQLLPYYEFCTAESEIYMNTINVIQKFDGNNPFTGCSIIDDGLPHMFRPCGVRIANDLLCKRTYTGIRMLKKTIKDNATTCESADEKTGERISGDAFATHAGFLAFSIYHSC